jgi:prepilin-type N-terminal cleavage/methylation domain-containing protein
LDGGEYDPLGIVGVIMVYPVTSKNGGFTLIELLISLAIFSVIIGGIFSFSISQRKYFAVQEQISEMAQNARAAMDMISGEVALAKYNPEGAVFTGIPYHTSQLQIYADLNGTCKPAVACVPGDDPGDANENIIYSHDSSTKRIVRNTGGGNQPLAENVEKFVFSYLDALGDVISHKDKEADIRQIEITIITRTSKKDPQYIDNDGYRTFTLTSVVTPRNLAF